MNITGSSGHGSVTSPMLSGASKKCPKSPYIAQGAQCLARKMKARLTMKNAGAGLEAWARAQLDNGVDMSLVIFCIVLAIGDLLVEGDADLPDLRQMTRERSRIKTHE